MYRTLKNLIIILILAISMTILPASAVTTLTDDDTKFLTDITSEGIPLFYEIPTAMKTGFFQGTETAIPTIGQEQTAALDNFLNKINSYSLSDEIKALRDQYLASAEVYKKDLTEYSTLVNSCGSCITQINEMYPRLTDEAKNTTKMVITFYQKSLIPIS